MSFKPANVVFLWNCWSLGVLSVYVSVVGFYRVGARRKWEGGEGKNGQKKKKKKDE